MANDKAKTVNKSAAIRSALTQYPNKGPVEIARLLSKQLGVRVSPKHVSAMKSKVRLQRSASATPQPAPAAGRQTAAPAPSVSAAAPQQGGVAEIVATLQGYLQRLGKEDLRRLIDVL